MTLNSNEQTALETVRELEKVRIVAIRDNDADAMDGILDEKFIYINGSGKIYDRYAYTTAVRFHELTYSSDLQLTETDHRVDGDLIILEHFSISKRHSRRRRSSSRIRLG